MNAIDIVKSRLISEEGVRKFAYDDSTGKTITCKPVGNLTIGVGHNLENGLDGQDVQYFLNKDLLAIVAAIQGYIWYKACDPVRQSVLIDLAFNGGIVGLLRYPKMLAAIQKMDWETAAGECTVSDPHLDASRYAPLRKLLLTGGNE